MHAKVMNIINFEKAFSQFDDHWNPRIVADLNGQQVKVAKLLGEFDWHHHENEDELFLVHRGELELQIRDENETEKSVVLRSGECFVVPKGVVHRPVAHEEVEVILFEPATTLNTGNMESERTRRELDRLV